MPGKTWKIQGILKHRSGRQPVFILSNFYSTPSSHLPTLQNSSGVNFIANYRFTRILHAIAFISKCRKSVLEWVSESDESMPYITPYMTIHRQEKGAVSETTFFGGRARQGVPARTPYMGIGGQGKKECRKPCPVWAGSRQKVLKPCPLWMGQDGVPGSRLYMGIYGRGKGDIRNNMLCRRSKTEVSEAMPYRGGARHLSSSKQAMHGYMWAGKRNASETPSHLGGVRQWVLAGLPYMGVCGHGKQEF